MLPIYKLTINDNDDTGVDYNAFVDTPAHLKAFIAFNESMPYKFKEEQRIVTGVMMSANTLIYRNSPDIGEHQVFFDAETIKQIVLKFFKNSFGNNVNKMHNENDKVKQTTMFESYFIDSKRGVTAPIEFEKQNLQDGTWIASYKVEDDKLWSEVKSGKFQGFSVEGIFDRIQVNLKTNNKQKMNKKEVTGKSLFERVFGKTKFEDVPATEEVVTSFAEITSIDGTVLTYEGDLAIDTPIFVTDENGEQLPAPNADYQCEIDGVVTVVSVNESGLVSNVEVVEIEEEMASDKEAILTEVSEVMKSTLEQTFKAIEELKAEIKAIKGAKESKFNNDAKVGAKTAVKMTASDILSLNK